MKKRNTIFLILAGLFGGVTATALLVQPGLKNYPPSFYRIHLSDPDLRYNENDHLDYTTCAALARAFGLSIEQLSNVGFDLRTLALSENQRLALQDTWNSKSPVEKLLALVAGPTAKDQETVEHSYANARPIVRDHLFVADMINRCATLTP